MQNQPPDTYKVIYEQVDLPVEFPIQDMFKDLLVFVSAPVTLMHFHNVLEIGYCYNGCGLFFIDGKVEPYAAGDVNVIFPGQVHVVQSDKTAPSHWDFIMINPCSLLSELSINELNLVSSLYHNRCFSKNIFRPGDSDEIADIAKRIFVEIGQKANHYKPMLKSLVWEMMIALSRIEKVTEEGVRHDQSNDILRIAPALNYISEHYREEVKITDLAKVCLMSTTNLRRLFVATLGKSPSEYLYEVRIKMASLLLVNSTSTILDISMNVGYPTLSGFNRHFKKFIGMSPREMRRDYAGQSSLLPNIQKN
jgi:AraC-like DNA-binding protein